MTAGGGGFVDQADRLFSLVADAIRRVAGEGLCARWLVVLGPNHPGSPSAEALRALPDVTVVAATPRLVDVVAAADLVIAEGGYNTVAEVRLAGAPAVFVPSARRLDDQAERVRRVADSGAAYVVDPAGPDQALSELVVELLSQPPRLEALKSAAQATGIVLGNEQAGAIIAAMAA